MPLSRKMDDQMKPGSLGWGCPYPDQRVVPRNRYMLKDGLDDEKGLWLKRSEKADSRRVGDN